MRSFHSYVLLWPSQTADGKYSWANDPASAKPAYRSDEMVRIANINKRDRNTAGDDWVIDPDLSENIEAAIRWMQSDKCRPAIEGQGGDQRTYDTAAMMRSFGLSAHTAFELMWEHFNLTKCVPPWDEGEFSEKIANAYSYASSPPGNMTSAYRTERHRLLFHSKNDEERERGKRHESAADDIELVDVSTRPQWKVRWRGPEMDELRQPTMWLIRDLLGIGHIVWLYGDSETYKSLWALALAYAVATGRSPILDDADIQDTGRVVIAAGEGVQDIMRRMDVFETYSNDGEIVSNIGLLDEPVIETDQDIRDFVSAIKRALPEDEPLKLLVIDTYAAATLGLDENSAKDFGQYKKMARTIQRLWPGCVVLTIDHIGHENKERAKGTIGKRNDVDASYQSTCATQPYFRIMQKKMKGASKWKEPRYYKAEQVMHSDGETSIVAALDTDGKNRTKKTEVTAEEVSLGHTRRAVKTEVAQELIERNGRPVTATELARIVSARPHCKGIPERTIREWLTKPTAGSKRKNFWAVTDAHVGPCYQPEGGKHIYYARGDTLATLRAWLHEAEPDPLEVTYEAGDEESDDAVVPLDKHHMWGPKS